MATPQQKVQKHEEQPELSKLQQIQNILGVVPDGKWGKKSQAALEDIINPHLVTGEHRVMASSFADPMDLFRFRNCVANGRSEKACLAVGDNGVGVWGDKTSPGSGPACALPPEDWRHFGSKARGLKVRVQFGDQEVICELRDTMPHRDKLANEAEIDLNYDAWIVLGASPAQIEAGMMEHVVWSFVES